MRTNNPIYSATTRKSRSERRADDGNLLRSTQPHVRVTSDISSMRRCDLVLSPPVVVREFQPRRLVRKTGFNPRGGNHKQGGTKRDVIRTEWVKSYDNGATRMILFSGEMACPVSGRAR